MNVKARLPRVTLITPALSEAVIDKTRRALSAPISSQVAVQVRGPGLAARDMLRFAQALRALTHEAGALLYLNDRVDIARAVHADGVQLPERSFSPLDAARAWPEPIHLGASCHDARGLHAAADRGADFALLSPFADTPGKGKPLGTVFESLVASSTIPVLALGGIGVTETTRAVRAGAYGVAVIRAVYEAPDPSAALRALSDAVCASDLGHP